MKKYFSTGISREFTYSPLFPWKNQSSLLERLVASASFKKRQMFCPLPTCNSLYFEQTYTNQNIITFCAITFCVTFMYYILRQKLLHFALPTLLHFALLLHFVAKVITFCVTVTFCGVTTAQKLTTQVRQNKLAREVNILLDR